MTASRIEHSETYYPHNRKFLFKAKSFSALCEAALPSHNARLLSVLLLHNPPLEPTASHKNQSGAYYPDITGSSY